MADKVKEVAVEEAEYIKSLASDAARSGAYLYPVRVSVIPTFEAGLSFAAPALEHERPAKPVSN